MIAWLVPVVALLGLASAAGADAIQKWRTPSGGIYFGDRPPSGSTLVETYADTAPATPAAPAVAPASSDAGLSEAAAQGREIIRQRQDQRAEERRADQEREAREAAAAAAAPVYTDDPTWWIVTGVAPCRVGENCAALPTTDIITIPTMMEGVVRPAGTRDSRSYPLRFGHPLRLHLRNRAEVR